jgi:glycosyltransferase involved in cell wall biosynthesis
MTRVCMLVHNSLEFDPRVEREAATLAAAGYDVTVIATWEPDRTARKERRAGFKIRRVSRRRPGIDLVSRSYGGISGGAERWRERKVTRGRIAMLEERVRRILARFVLLGVRIPVRLTRRVLRELPTATQSWAIENRMTAAAVATRPHIVHAHDLNTLRAAARAARLTRARLVYDSHEIPSGLPTVRSPEQVIRYEAGLIRRADAVIHTTPMRAAWTAETYGIPMPAVVRNIPEGSRDVAPADLVALAGFALGSKVILHQGNMQPHRGLEALTEAIGLLPDEFALLYLGGGRLRGELETLVEKLGLGERVRFASAVPHAELLAWTAGAWCGVSMLVDVCLNHRYSLPNKLFEYVAVGVPLVASDNPEIAGFVTEWGVGEVCDPTNPDSIAAAVTRLAARRDDAAARARDAGSVFRWENEARTLLNVYGSLGA